MRLAKNGCTARPLNMKLPALVSLFTLLSVGQPLQAAEQARFRLGYGAGDDICEAQFQLLDKHAKAATLPVCEVGVVLPPGSSSHSSTN